MAPKLYLMHMSPPCRAVLLTAKALNLDLEVVEVERDAMKAPDKLKLNPQHTVPTLVDDDFSVWDSHAIIGYLVAQYAENDTLYPKDPRQRATVDQRLHFENGVLFSRFAAAVGPLFHGSTSISDEAVEKIAEAYSFLDAFLEGRTWIASNDLTIADFSILATMSSCELAVPVDASKFPRLAKWLQQGKDLPYFDEANEKGLEAVRKFISEKLTG